MAPNSAPPPIIFWILMTLVIASFVAGYFLTRRLRHSHGQLWADLGSPTLFWNNSMRNQFLMMRFIWTARASKTADSVLVAMVWTVRIITFVFFFVFLGFAGAVFS